MGKITGIAASSGRVAGRAFRIGPAAVKNPVDNLTESNCLNTANDEHFLEAYTTVHNRLATHARDNAIFAAHLEILEDLKERIQIQIMDENRDAVTAVRNTCEEVCALFAGIEDDYLRARSDDIVDICEQLIAALTSKTENPFADMPSGSIILADNLLPSDTLMIDLSKLAGIALKKGSINSHLAILAKNNAIPLVLAVGDGLDEISEGNMIVVDGDKGQIISNPDTALVQELTHLRTIPEKTDPAPAITEDGEHIEVYANAGSFFDVEKAISRGAEGIGLLRTEFIFMQGTRFPDEDEQYTIYSECAKTCKNKPLTIRTLDIGADKQLPYYSIDPEENPAFGLRGIRFSLAFPDIFKVQLRAVLRAAVHGNIRLMFPMITSVAEYNNACIVLENCKQELQKEGKPFAKTLSPGIMIETPASVFLADELAPIVAFFSIGTNDLTQYVLAVDRENPYSENACDSFHPAVIKSLTRVAEAAKIYGTEVSVCGEMASDPQATPILLNLGIRKLSVTSLSIPSIKEKIRKQVIKPPLS